MTKKKKSKNGQLFRITRIISTVALSVFLFTGNNHAQTVVAQQQEGTVVAFQNSKLEALFKDSIFAARYKEYNQIIKKYEFDKRGGKKAINLTSIPKDDLDKMKELFLAMTPEQQATLQLTFKRKGMPAERCPTEDEYESWKDAAMYGVWIDGKRINNSELSRYRYSDFSLFFISRLSPNEENYGRYTYQLELTTTANYRKLKAEVDADKDLYLTPNFLTMLQ